MAACARPEPFALRTVDRKLGETQEHISGIESISSLRPRADSGGVRQGVSSSVRSAVCRNISLLQVARAQAPLMAGMYPLFPSCTQVVQSAYRPRIAAAEVPNCPRSLTSLPLEQKDVIQETTDLSNKRGPRTKA